MNQWESATPTQNSLHDSYNYHYIYNHNRNYDQNCNYNYSFKYATIMSRHQLFPHIVSLDYAGFTALISLRISHYIYCTAPITPHLFHYTSFTTLQLSVTSLPYAYTYTCTYTCTYACIYT